MLMPGSEPRDGATLLVLFGLLTLGGGLLGLMALVVPQALGLILIVGGFVGFGALHYLIWGWWLGPHLSQERKAELPEDEPPRA
jgi:hypothetical protein